MKKCETKEKGDIGVAMVIADLTRRGFSVAIPLAEHLPFDLVVISPECKTSRISVKYSKDDDCVKISLRTVSSNSNGYVVKRVNCDDLDGFAVYSPISNECYYINKNTLGGAKNTISLRIKEAKCTNQSQVKYAKNFLDPTVLF
jgi:hypothetical protein